MMTSSVFRTMLAFFILNSVPFFWSPTGGADDSIMNEIRKVNSNNVLFLRFEAKVETEKNEEKNISWEGTGFIINKDGFVLTAAHLVNDRTKYKNFKIFGMPRSRYDQYREVELWYVQDLSTTDIAILKLPNNATPWKEVKILPAQLKIGEQVYALGFPLSEDLLFSLGILNSLDNKTNQWIASLQPIGLGSSGSPVFDGRGKAIGVLTGGFYGKGIAHVRPINQIYDWLKLNQFFSDSIDNINKEPIIASVEGKKKTLVKYKSCPIDVTFDQHAIFSISQLPYEFFCEADQNFNVVDAQFKSKSANNMENLTTKIADDSRQAKISFVLSSGPIFDQWRGWLKGELIITQEEILPAKTFKIGDSVPWDLKTTLELPQVNVRDLKEITVKDSGGRVLARKEIGSETKSFYGKFAFDIKPQMGKTLLSVSSP